MRELVARRVFGLAPGYEDLNDPDRLRLDPLLAVLVGKEDPSGQDRLLVECLLESYREPPAEI